MAHTRMYAAAAAACAAAAGGLGFCRFHGTPTTAASASMSPAPDAPIVVIGGGVMGRATAWKLARRELGTRVVLIDAGHAVRGSWGSSRASHLSMEDRTLLRMGLSSMDDFDSLEIGVRPPEEEAEGPIRTSTGRVFVGPLGAMNGITAALRDVCPDDKRCEHVVQSWAQVKAAFDGRIQLEKDEEAVHLPNGGYILHVDRAMAALSAAGTQAGVVVHEVERVVGVDRQARVVETDSGRRQPYSQIVFCAGPWTNNVLDKADLNRLPVVVSLEQTIDFKTKATATATDGASASEPHAPGRMPLLTYSEAGYKGTNADGTCRYFYCVPSLIAPGLKVGFHREGELLDTPEFPVSEQGRALLKGFPHTRKRTVEKCNLGTIDAFPLHESQQFVRKKFPHLDPDAWSVAMRCPYQMSPDMNMIVGALSQDPDCFVACGFTGSGFQFAPAVGDLITALVARRRRAAASKGPREGGQARGGVKVGHLRVMEKRFAPGRFDE